MFAQTRLLFQNPPFLHSVPHPSIPNLATPPSRLTNLELELRLRPNIASTRIMASSSKPASGSYALQLDFNSHELESFLDVGNKVADAAGEILRKYFRKKVDILDKEDLSPVTIADQTAEEVMVSIISDKLPSHAIFGEEHGWTCKEETADFLWVLDPIDGTRSFITGKPLFGTLIALVHKGTPVIGIIDQPILKERWIGITGRKTTLNGEEVTTRTCEDISQAYLYSTSPHLFFGEAEEAFSRVRSKVKTPLYGCDCYAYALLASGFVDIVCESGLMDGYASGILKILGCHKICMYCI